MSGEVSYAELRAPENRGRQYAALRAVSDTGVDDDSIFI